MRVVSESFRGIAMVEEIKLDFYSAYTATYLFLDSLWDYLEGKITSEEREHFGKLMGIAYHDSAWAIDWEDAVKQFYGNKIDRSARISSVDCLSIFILFLKIFRDQFGHQCNFLVHIAENMQNSPEKHQNEWKLWKKAINNSCLGNYINDGREESTY